MDHPSHERAFLATQGGVGLSDEHKCAHGQPGIVFHLFNQDDQAGPLTVVVPSCIAPALFGTALAQVKADSGPEAAKEFLDVLLDACDTATAKIAIFTAEREHIARSCCEAGYRTGGIDHLQTCPAATPSV
jgi:hypothetical protein